MRFILDFTLCFLMFLMFYLAFTQQLKHLWRGIRKHDDPQDAMQIMARLKELLPKSHGFTTPFPTVPLIVATLVGVSFISLAYRRPGHPSIVELHNVHVLRDIGRYEYWLEAENGQRFYSVFCTDYEPQFSKGQTLLVLKYEDRGICWSVANTHPAYLIERDENGKPKLR